MVHERPSHQVTPPEGVYSAGELAAFNAGLTTGFEILHEQVCSMGKYCRVHVPPIHP